MRVQGLLVDHSTGVCVLRFGTDSLYINLLVFIKVSNNKKNADML